MTRKGCCAVIVLMKKRTAAVICGAMALVAAVVCVFAAHRDKPVVSPEPVTAQTVLVIDAGHGGEDGGAVSASGVPERIPGKTGPGAADGTSRRRRRLRRDVFQDAPRKIRAPAARTPVPTPRPRDDRPPGPRRYSDRAPARDSPSRRGAIPCRPAGGHRAAWRS